MGKLRKKTKKKKNTKVTKGAKRFDGRGWGYKLGLGLMGIGVGWLGFWGVSVWVEAAVLEAPEELTAWLEPDEMGMNQVWVDQMGGKIRVSREGLTHAGLVVDASKLAYMVQVGSQWQIVIYRPGGGEVHLTTRDNNVNPKISGKYVVWEAQIDGVWQVMVYDGIKREQITSGEGPAQDVVVNGTSVAYTQKQTDGGWRVFVHDLEKGSRVNISGEGYGRKPEFVENKLRWQSQIEGGGRAFFDYDLDSGESVASEEVSELNQLIQMTEEASVAAELEQYGEIEDGSLLETLWVLGVVDEKGRVRD